MSISTMVSLGMQRQHEVSEPAAAAAAGGGGGSDSGSGVQGALSKLTAFVPSEVVGLYVAGLGTLTPETSFGKWCLFGFGILLIPAFMLVSYFIQKKQDGKKNPSWARWFILLGFAVVGVCRLGCGFARNAVPRLESARNGCR